MNPETLWEENQRFKNTGGVSQRTQQTDLRPAFLDSATGEVYLSRFADGRLAPMHLLDGLPAGLVQERDAQGRVIATRETVMSGFERGGRFFTREEASLLVTMRSRRASY